MHGSTIALIYHDVATRDERDRTGFPGPLAGAYKLDPGVFTAHLDAIAAKAVKVGLYAERPDALLTFDDGGASAAWIAEELEKRGMRGAFFVVTARIGTDGFLGADQIRDLVARGHEIGSHSHTHPSYMARLSGAELAHEWATSRELLAELLGVAPPSAAVPGGSVSPEVIEQAAQAGYERVFTSTPGSRPSRRSGITVVGRYTIWANDPPGLAAAFASGARAPRVRRWLAWQLKSGAKRVSPRAYEAVRAARAGWPSGARKDASRSI